MENVKAHSLARLESGLENDALEKTPIELLSEPIISASADHIMPVDHSTCWVKPIFEYLTKGKVAEEKSEARRIKYQANRYAVLNEKLYR